MLMWGKFVYTLTFYIHDIAKYVQIPDLST